MLFNRDFVITIVSFFLSSFLSSVGFAETVQEVYYLDNGLPVIFEYNEDAPPLSLSLGVNVGLFAGTPGLAHFVEHLMTSQSEAFPIRGESKTELRKRGSYNAYTLDQATIYFFKANKSYLELIDDSVHRFADFFVAPIFTPESLAHQGKRVHDEFNRFRADRERGLDLIRQQFRPGHPARNVFEGNWDTLEDVSVSDVSSFVDQYYGIENMALAVATSMNIEEVKSLVEANFGRIPKRHATKTVLGEAYEKGGRSKFITYQSLAKGKELRVEFSFETQPEDFLTQPLYQISNLLGVESEGSISELLKESSLVKSFMVHSGEYAERQTLSIVMQLTSYGEKNTGLISRLVFDYIDFLKNKANLDTSWDYLKPKLDKKFSELKKEGKYYSKNDDLIKLFFEGKHPNVFSIHEQRLVLTDSPSRKTRVSELLASLTVENANIYFLTSNEVPSSLPFLTPYHKVPYQISRVEDILPESGEVLTRIREDYRTPKFKPAYVFPKGPLYPTKLLEKLPVEVEGASIWYANNAEVIKKPIALFNIEIKTPYCAGGSGNIALCSFWTQLLRTKVKREIEKKHGDHLYNIDFSAAYGKWNIEISAYGEIIHNVVKTTLDEIQKFTLSRVDFEKEKENFSEEFDVVVASGNIKGKAMDQFLAVYQNSYNLDEFLKSLEKMQFENFQRFQSQVFQQFEVKLQAYGHVDQAKLQENIQFFQERWPQEISIVNQVRKKRKLDSKQFNNNMARIESTIPGQQSAYVSHLFYNRTTVENVLVTLIGSKLMADFYSKVVTNKEATGYESHVIDDWVLGYRKGLLFYMTSTENSPAELEAVIESFKAQFLENLDDLIKEEYEAIVQKIKSSLVGEGNLNQQMSEFLHNVYTDGEIYRIELIKLLRKKDRFKAIFRKKIRSLLLGKEGLRIDSIVASSSPAPIAPKVL